MEANPGAEELFHNDLPTPCRCTENCAAAIAATVSMDIGIGALLEE